MTGPLPLRVEVPVCAFRPYASREYQDTFPVPPPATVYGMLLSMVGEPASPLADVAARHKAKEKHRGIEMALAIRALPERRSRVFRKLRRGADLEDTRPDYQDLLIDLKLWVWLRRGADPANPTLSERIPAALSDPATISRCGGLSLGESSYLVDVISIDPSPPDQLHFLIPDENQGFYSLPVWVDHLVRANTVLNRFRLSEPIAVGEGLANGWTRIGG